MCIDGSLLLRNFLAHGNGNIPRSIAVIAHAAEFLAHQTVGASVNDFFELGCNWVKPVKNPLSHQPARLRSVALKAIKFIGWALFLWPRHVLHGIGRPMTVT